MDLTAGAQNLFKEIFGDGLLGDLINLLSENPQTAYPKAWSLMENLYNNVMVPIALGLMVIWFLVKFMEKSTLEQTTYEQALLLFVKLLVAKLLIDYGIEIFTGMWSLGLSVVKEFGAGASASATAGGAGSTIISAEELETMWEDFTGSPWDKKMGWSSIGVYIQLLIPWLVTLIIRACAYFIVYSRLIEMFLRMCGAPIALSDFMSEGMQGAGWRYIKNFLAICLQGLLIVAIARLYSIIILDVITGKSGWDLIIAHLAVGFASVALMFKSLSLSKELLGTA